MKVKFSKIIEKKSLVITYILGLFALWSVIKDVYNNNKQSFSGNRISKLEKQMKVIIDAQRGEMELYKIVYNKSGKNLYHTNKVNGKFDKWFLFKDPDLLRCYYDVAKDDYYCEDFDNNKFYLKWQMGK